jgi:hypothetical protein
VLSRGSIMGLLTVSLHAFVRGDCSSLVFDALTFGGLSMGSSSSKPSKPEAKGPRIEYTPFEEGTRKRRPGESTKGMIKSDGDWERSLDGHVFVSIVQSSCLLPCRSALCPFLCPTTAIERDRWREPMR